MCHSGDVCVQVCVHWYPVEIIISKSHHPNLMWGQDLMCVCVCVWERESRTGGNSQETHTYTTVDHSLASTRVYSIITILQSLWTWPHPVVDGGGWLATYQPDHVCLLDRLCVFRHSAAMQSSARGNQLQSVTLSCCVGEESLHLSLLMNRDSAVWF